MLRPASTLGRSLKFGVELPAGLDELPGLLLHPFLERLVLGHPLFCSIFADVLGDFHRTEVRPAHRAEVRRLSPFLRQGLIVELTGGEWIEAEVKLILPAEFKARLAQG